MTTLSEEQELLKTLAAAMARSATGDWVELTLRVSSAGGLTKTVLTAEPEAAGRGLRLVSDGVDAAGELREDVMYDEDAGSWYNATFRLRRSGEFESTFDYDNPPDLGDDLDDLLREDQEEWPRARQVLPPWHPAGKDDDHS